MPLLQHTRAARHSLKLGPQYLTIFHPIVRGEFAQLQGRSRALALPLFDEDHSIFRRFAQLVDIRDQLKEQTVYFLRGQLHAVLGSFLASSAVRRSNFQEELDNFKPSPLGITPRPRAIANFTLFVEVDEEQFPTLRHNSVDAFHQADKILGLVWGSVECGEFAFAFDLEGILILSWSVFDPLGGSVQQVPWKILEGGFRATSVP